VVLEPQSPITHNGVARATIAAKDQIGFCHVTVQVDNLTDQLLFNIQERSPWAGGPVYR
jgi:hypothetical protein